MTANEMADMIDSDNWVPMDDEEHNKWEMQAAVMLRHQANQIEALKTQLAYLEAKVYGGTTK